jgi:hypothetical protein
MEDAKKGDKQKQRVIADNHCVKEMKSLCYVPAKWRPGFEPTKKDLLSNIALPAWQTPLVKAHFLGLQKNPKSEYPKKIGPLNPEWIKHFFKGVFVQLVMLKPNHWWPMVIGNARNADADKAPTELMVLKLKIKYPQHELDQCLIRGVASSLYYCGLKEMSWKVSGTAHKFECLTKTLALKELRNVMQEYVPCIGKCTVYNVRAKNKKIKQLSIEDLIEHKTRFPTVVIPYGKDGSNNHSFVVVDDLIFDSTQTHPMKLCRESLDWICGEKGMASINIALRFNQSVGTKEKLQNKEKTNW